MKTLKFILVAVAALVFSWSAHAQSSSAGLRRWSETTTIMSGGTNNVTAATTNSYTTLTSIEVPRADSFTLQLSALARGTNKTTLVFTLQPSVDKSTWGLDSTRTITLSGSTTNVAAVVVTNIQCGSIPYWRISSIVNSETEGYATNVTVKYGFKQ